MRKIQTFILTILLMMTVQISFAQEDIVIRCDEIDEQYYELCYTDSLLYMDDETQDDPDAYYHYWTDYCESLTDEERARDLEQDIQVLRYPDETDIPRERARALGYAVLEQHFGVAREQLPYYYTETICLEQKDGSHVWQVMLTRVAWAELDRSTYYVHIDPHSERILEALKL